MNYGVLFSPVLLSRGLSIGFIGGFDGLPIPRFNEVNEWAEVSVFLRCRGNESHSHPSTRWTFFLKSGVSSSASVVFLAFSIVATNPSVISSWLASSDVFFVIVGGVSLCLVSSCIVFVGSTRLTQTSLSEFCSPDSFF